MVREGRREETEMGHRKVGDIHMGGEEGLYFKMGS